MGKTTLVSEWAENQGRPVAWLTVDTFDNDPQLFWSHVVAALRAARSSTGRRCAGRLRSDPGTCGRSDPASQCPGPGRPAPSSVLVPDDFQEITDRALVREVLAAVLQSRGAGSALC